MPRKLRPVIVREDGTAVVTLTQGRVALIDATDVDEVGKWNWYAFKGADRSYYARSHVIRPDGTMGKEMLHRFLWRKWGRQGSPVLDHEDGDGLNCRGANIRAATAVQNGSNKRRWLRNKSGIKGVDQTHDGKWRAQIMRFGKKYSLGKFLKPEDAGEAYRNAALELHGDFARTA